RHSCLREREAHVREESPVAVETVDAAGAALVVVGVARREHEPVRVRSSGDQLVHVAVEFGGDGSEFDSGESSLVIERAVQRVGSQPDALCQLLLPDARAAHRSADPVTDGRHAPTLRPDWENPNPVWTEPATAEA